MNYRVEPVRRRSVSTGRDCAVSTVRALVRQHLASRARQLMCRAQGRVLLEEMARVQAHAFLRAARIAAQPLREGPL